jgi:DNA-binding transcriptional MerR regulator/methylmalonyl-CoA mutase cobalamin-binding subunit
MSAPLEAPGLLLDISGVERETGLSKDVLRMWERRYGFPKPGRDGNGERQYSVDEVTRLRAIKRLMDVGMRPGKIVRESTAELTRLAGERVERRAEHVAPAVERELVALLRAHDATALRNALTNHVMRNGLERFVLETMAPLNRVVGEAWMRGELHTFEEHLYTEQVLTVLRTAIGAFARPAGAPRMLATTFPGEQHGLGLLMLEAILVPEGVQWISLGVQTPLEDIRRAALAHGADVVALSFSTAFPVRQASDGLASLRHQLPPAMALWAGGEMTRRVRRTLPGVTLIPDLGGAVPALGRWRAEHAGASGRPVAA